MNFRRGFKAECERVAIELREELGLSAAERLDPHLLAKHLAIPVASLAEFASSCGAAVAQLTSADRGCFSAATVFFGPRRMIVYNPAHPPGRHANSVAHELAHVLLEHEPGAVRERSGERRWRAADEAEADWLAATLLAPREGILQVMYELGEVGAAAAHFGISEALMRWRLNHTGVARQIQRARARAS